MLNSVTFFNNCNNGDVHVSRTFVRDLTSKVIAREYRYAHKNSPRLLLDQPWLKIIPPQDYPDVEVARTGDDVIINTWYGCMGGRFNIHWCHFDSLWNLFRAAYDHLLLPMPQNKVDFLPKIDYSAFYLEGVNRFFHMRGKKPSILVVNSACHSNQATNFDMSPAIAELSRRYPTYDFLVTDRCPATGPNIFYTPDIIGLQGSDLNENSYISTKCKMIIGRSTGAFTFSLTKDNLLDPNKIFVGISNGGGSAIQWFDEAKCKTYVCVGANEEIKQVVCSALG